VELRFGGDSSDVLGFRFMNEYTGKSRASVRARGAGIWFSVLVRGTGIWFSKLPFSCSVRDDW
jgi:hypothetical protein